MEKKIKIKVNSIITYFFRDGNEVVEEKDAGTGIYFSNINYDNVNSDNQKTSISFIDVIEGKTNETFIICYKDMKKVKISRRGQMCYDLELTDDFDDKKKTKFTTAEGSLEFEVKSDKLVYEVNEESVLIKLEYSLYVSGEIFNKCQLEIKSV